MIMHSQRQAVISEIVWSHRKFKDIFADPVKNGEATKGCPLSGDDKSEGNVLFEEHTEDFYGDKENGMPRISNNSQEVEGFQASELMTKMKPRNSDSPLDGRKSDRPFSNSPRRDRILEDIIEETDYPSDIDFLDDVSSNMGIKFRHSRGGISPQGHQIAGKQQRSSHLVKMNYYQSRSGRQNGTPYRENVDFADTVLGSINQQAITSGSKKRPSLITNLNFTSPPSAFRHMATENRMIYNSEKKCWEGNDEQLEDFRNINTFYTAKCFTPRQSPRNPVEDRSQPFMVEVKPVDRKMSAAERSSINVANNEVSQVDDDLSRSNSISDANHGTDKIVPEDDSFFALLDTSRISEETDIDISGRELRRIPNIESLMPHLKSFDASSNVLMSIGKLPGGLNDLLLGHNRLRSFEFLSNLKDLVRLDLQGNRIQHVDFVSSLAKLEVLNLDDNNITDISFVRHLPLLRDFSLARNKLRNIRLNGPNNTLQQLNLAGNCLVSVSGIEALHSVQELSLDSNSLGEFRIIGTLPHLKKLSVAFNRLAEFNADMIPEIETLFLDNNSFEWHESRSKHYGVRLKNAARLSCLSLNGNDLRHVRISWPPSLSILYLERCMMHEFPANLVSNCPNLTRLFLQQNFLSDLCQLGHLNRLELLDLYDNTLRNTKLLCDQLKALSSLKLIDLR